VLGGFLQLDVTRVRRARIHDKGPLTHLGHLTHRGQFRPADATYFDWTPNPVPVNHRCMVDWRGQRFKLVWESSEMTTNPMSGIPVEGGRSETPASNACVFPNAQACGARTRAGGLCRLPAVKNNATGMRKRCQRHGGRSSGPKKPIVKHGYYTKAFKSAQRAIREKLKKLREGAASYDVTGG
jgi:hypothetical protein